MSKERIMCKTHCIQWNEQDKDCDLYGENHPCPKKCPFWLQAQTIKLPKEQNLKNEVQDEQKS